MTPLLLKLIFSFMPTNAPGLMRRFVKSMMGQAQARISDPQIKMHVDYWQAASSRNPNGSPAMISPPPTS